MDKDIDFTQNLNPFKLKEYLGQFPEFFISKIYVYPEKFSEKTVKAISDFLKIPPDNIILTNGLTGFYFALPTLFKNKSRWLVIYPTFWEYPYVAKQYGNRIVSITCKERDNFILDLEELQNKIMFSDIVFLCNPNNPTSTLIKKESIEYLLNKNKKKLFIIDETYLIFRKDYNINSLGFDAVKFKNLIVATSISKIFSIPGLRLGLIITNKNLTGDLKRKITPYQINTIAENIAIDIFENKKFLCNFLSKSRNYINQEKFRVISELSKISGLKIFPSEANFVLVKITAMGITAESLSNKLEKHQIKIRICSKFKGLGNKYFRISILSRKDNNYLISQIKKILFNKN